MLAHDSKPSMLLRQPGQMGPMGTNFGTTDGFSTERDKIYHARRTLKMSACRGRPEVIGARSKRRV
jgi:hypothetical protein